ncbi:MAG: peptidoglycan DD-metalloendopeptidase family protein [Thermomicrobiales bacterium]|nr:peptidoglycan DD-metalloendopeptidase family protein [Thermomicrobiales bacterium]
MFTARKSSTIAARARMLALAATLTLASLLPVVGSVYADSGSQTSTETNQTALVAEQAFDVDPADGLDNITAIVVAPVNDAPLLAEPKVDAEVVEPVEHGTEVLLLIDIKDTVTTSDGSRFWPVDVGGSTGWMNGRSLMSPEDFASYQAVSDGTAGTTSSSSTTTTTTTRAAFDFVGELIGAQAQVDADGEGLKMRAEPSADAEVVMSLSEGTIVDLRIADVDTVYDAAGTRWWPVSYDGYNGWVSGFYLVAPGTSGQSTSATDTPVLDGDYTYIPGDWAVIRTADEGRTNLYADASTSSGINGTAPHMALVEVIAQAPGGWYEVRWDTVQGFVPGDLLTAGTAPRRAQTDVDPAPTPTPAPVSTETVEAEEPASESNEAVTTNGNVSEKGFILPLETFRFTQDYGCSNLGFYSYDPNWGCSVHDGVDLAAAQGTPILAVADGTVVVSGWCNCGLGYYVEIDHGNGVHTIYGHQVAQPPVAVGDEVVQGQQIGAVGSTGLSTGPHVHFMVRVDGVSQDPKLWLPPIKSN